MALSLSQKQKTAQSIAPTLRWAFELLALPINELRERIRKELDSNPAIEAAVRGTTPHVQPVGDREFLVDNLRARGKTLQEHLLGELRMSGVSGRDFELASAIVGELDERGYFVGEMKSMAMSLDATVEELETARSRVMKIDPKGCGSRDLHECLLAQISIVPEGDRADFKKGIEHILDDSLPPAERLSDLAKKYVVKMKPNPGKDYEFVRTDYITPDAAVDEKGVVTVDTKDIPVLAVSPKYVEMAKDVELDEETREYAADKVAQARNFAAAIERRREIFERICEVAISRQAEHLSEGPDAFAVQTMSEVAKKVGCNISTVSRAADRKYIKTPFGVVQLKKFFRQRDAAPYEKLREVLAGFAPGENPSDKRVSELMTEAGFPMARRTVNKWRRIFNEQTNNKKENRK